MLKIRTLLSSVPAWATIAFLGGPSVVHAQFEGPAPIAWRWAQSTSVTPGGQVAVKGDTIYIAAGQRIFALDRESGNQKWRYPAGEPLEANFRSGVVLYGDTVIAAADNKLVYAVDANDGKTKWQYPSPEPILGPPVVAGKYIALALSDNSIMCISGDDGKAAWQNPQRIFDGILGNIGAFDENVLVFTQAYGFYSIPILSPTKVNWKTAFAVLGADVRPVVFGDNIYVNSGSNLVCVSAARGRPVWQRPTAEVLASNPSVSAEGIVAISRDQKVLSFDLSGRPLLKTGIDLQSQPVVPPTQLGKLAVIATSNGALNLIDPKTGDIVWTFVLRPLSAHGAKSTDKGTSTTTIVNYITAASPAVLAGQTLLVTGRDGSLFAFDRSLGVDLTPPKVRMFFPNSGDQVSGQPPLELGFKIEDEATGVNAKTLTVEIDDQKMDYQYNREGILIVPFSTTGKNKPLTDGRKTITVTASDWLGNTTKAIFSLMIDNTLRPAGRAGQTSPTKSGAGPGPGKGG